MTVGEIKRALRTLKVISQKTLEKLANMKEITIRRYKTGDRNPKHDQLGLMNR